MTTRILVACVVFWVASAGAQSAFLSPADIAAAIEQGQAGKTLQKKCGASGENGFDIVIEGPVGRIMRAAREAKRADREFTAADVSLALQGPFLTVTARRDHSLTTANSAVPLPGGQGLSVLPERVAEDRRHDLLTMGSAYRTDIVLRSKPSGSKEPVLLRPVGPIVEKWIDGRTILRPSPGSDLSASFDLAAFRAVPSRDVEVVIFTSDAGERRCKISDKDRQQLR
jgi:hypothetical protein